jgi:hypothetical protein
MRTLRLPLVVATALAALVAAPVPNALASRTTTPSNAPAGFVTDKDFNAKNFSAKSIVVDNPFLPLTPGAQYTLTGTTTGGKHEVVFTVTDVTKWVNHVRTVVIWDRDFQDGELAEEELAFMAQDDAGNVWSLGEYPEEHEDGEVSAPSTWLAGHRGATAGVLMQAHPQTGTPAYIQGRSPEIEFFDKAKVAQVNQKVCVPVDCYKGVLVVDEWDPTAQPEDGHQFKYHAPGVGVVKIVGKGGVEQETLVLTKYRTLSDDEMAQARARVFKLDRRAYTLAKSVYAKTPFAALR